MSRVVITAGAAGIGRAMADAFAATGAEVWVTDIDAAALSTVPDGIRAAKVDVSNEDEMRGFFNELRKEWGGLDVLCANAGTKGPTALIEDVRLADWRACTGATLDGAFLSAKFAAPMMKAQKSGAMIFTSSTAGIFGYPNRAPYAAAKWAVIGLMKTAAMELGPFGIRANAILPGAVEGPRMEAVLEAEAAAKGMTRDQVYQGYAAGTSMRTFVEARDVAEMAVFLASDAARYVSGQAIAVDGHTENPDPKV
ncbi:Sulfoquinovose 1-dehydrogenase [Defluviimonas aquaemixtae]|uniref:Sulfoquinovose 1-dehydrogenase n=1 Tax=Albidovulum aquaemixtae TaxID=1542388 RepID=A0A2R8B661_9RHOB|nr:SDR family oxidoreductase [Defluviimonas aquaemixtae]SPH18084.1 Sulfoquinovose 1-dehydrogenase [Defluviimonas aquaemixtae]